MLYLSTTKLFCKHILNKRAWYIVHTKYFSHELLNTFCVFLISFHLFILRTNLERRALASLERLLYLPIFLKTKSASYKDSWHPVQQTRWAENLQRFPRWVDQISPRHLASIFSCEYSSATSWKNILPRSSHWVIRKNSRQGARDFVNFIRILRKRVYISIHLWETLRIFLNLLVWRLQALFDNPWKLDEKLGVLNI